MWENASYPCFAEEVFEEEEFSYQRLISLSPYSPTFNPIGQTWYVLKAEVKLDLATQLSNILAWGKFIAHNQKHIFAALSVENIPF